MLKHKNVATKAPRHQGFFNNKPLGEPLCLRAFVAIFTGDREIEKEIQKPVGAHLRVRPMGNQMGNQSTPLNNYRHAPAARPTRPRGKTLTAGCKINLYPAPIIRPIKKELI